MKIKKVSQIAGLLASVLNIKTESDKDTYSCNYINSLYDELFYKDGESFEMTHASTSGLITSGNESVRFTIPVSKRLDNIKSVTINTLIAGIRHAAGKYICNDNTDLKTIGNLSVRISSPTSVSVDLTLSTVSDLANNAPLSVLMQNCKLTFNE